MAALRFLLCITVCLAGFVLVIGQGIPPGIVEIFSNLSARKILSQKFVLWVAMSLKLKVRIGEETLCQNCSESYSKETGIGICS